MEYYLFYSYIVCFLVISRHFIRKKNKVIGCKNNIDPFSVFTAVFFAYSAIGAFDRIGLYKNSLFVPIVFYMSAVLGYLAMSVGYINTLVKHKIRFSFIGTEYKIGFMPDFSLYKSRESRLMFFMFLFVVLLNFSKFIGLFTNMGSGISYAEVALRSERTASSGPLSFLDSLFALFMISFPIYNILKSKKISVVDILLLIGFILFSLTSGHRTSLVEVIIALMVVVNYRIKLIKAKYLAIIGVAGLFFLVALGHLRAESNIKDMYSLLSENGKELFELASSGEFSNTVGTCFTYIERDVNGEGAINFGLSWLNEVAMFIPTSLWHNRPLPLPEKYVKQFFPEAPDGYGKGWFVLTDGYMAFGVFGVILEMFLLGIVLAKCYLYFMRHNDDLSMIMYIFLLCYTFTLVRTSFLGTLKNYLIEMIPFLFIIILSKNRGASIHKAYE